MENSEKSEISEKSEKLFRVLDFALQPKSKTRIEKPRKKISEIFEISEISEFSTWPQETIDGDIRHCENSIKAADDTIADANVTLQKALSVKKLDRNVVQNAQS